MLKGIPVDDPQRGTGRSTGLMLKAISEALLNRCTWVEFHDHYRGVGDDWAVDSLEMLCVQIGLQWMRVHSRGSRVWIISLAPTQATPMSAPQHPECPPLP